jgi:hypothetical protein
MRISLNLFGRRRAGEQPAFSTVEAVVEDLLGCVDATWPGAHHDGGREKFSALRLRDEGRNFSQREVGISEGRRGPQGEG